MKPDCRINPWFICCCLLGLILWMSFSKLASGQTKRKYKEEKVTYKNEDAGIEIAGTFTLPDTRPPFPAVILISGSGPQDRDETVLGQRPFFVLADYLARCGIAVLRFDDRGIGKSQGDYFQSTLEDFASDVIAGFNYLKNRREIIPNRIGLIGHSEGGIVAPIAALKAPDISFIVLMASTALKIEDVFLMSNDLIARSRGATQATIAKQHAMHERLYSILKQQQDIDTLKVQLRALFQEYSAIYTEPEKTILGFNETEMEAVINYYVSPYVQFYLDYDPVQTLMKVKCPVLSIVGDKDMQSPPEASSRAIEAALKSGGNSDYVVKILPNLNHLLQTANTGALSEYSTIEETISPVALNIMSAWIIKQTNCTNCKQPAPVERKHKLENFSIDRTVVSHVGCIKSCLDFLDIKLTAAWLYGGTGYAFIICIDEYFDGAAVSRWKKDKIHELGRNLGYNTEIITANKSDEDFASRVKFAWDEIKKAIDHGYPCYGWELDLFLYYIIHKYDTTGYYYKGLFCQNGKGPKPWQDLKKIRSNAFEMYVVKPGEKSDDKKIIKDALEFILDFNNISEKYTYAGFKTGLAAYDLWLQMLQEGKAKGYGMAWYTEFWSACRKYTVPFLDAAKKQLTPQYDTLFNDAIEQYAVVTECLSRLSELFPYLNVSSEQDYNVHVKDADRIKRGIELLETARKAESHGLEVLKKIANQL